MFSIIFGKRKTSYFKRVRGISSWGLHRQKDKERVIKTKISIILLLICLINSGCASYLVYNNSREKIILRNAVNSKDNNAIKAIALNNGGAGIGIDIASCDTLTEQPFLQFMAALYDALTIYGGYKVEKSVAGSSSGHSLSSITISGQNNNVVIVNGDNNSVGK